MLAAYQYAWFPLYPEGLHNVVSGGRKPFNHDFTDCWRSDLCGTMDSSEETGGSSAEENYFVNYTFTDRSHSGRVAQGIMKLCLEDELFADVTISVEGKEFQLHRLVLSAQSCFFSFHVHF